ncbi:MAG: NADH-quinone oxidoreductase subunit A [Verrucomicrobia bacterium]|nr:NADH-quinone oxidoreductase subunit A [Verrucomicrobiota bacterium]
MSLDDNRNVARDVNLEQSSRWFLFVRDFPLAFAARRSYCRDNVSAEFSQFLPVGLLILVAIAFAAGMLITSTALGQKGSRPAVKDTPYECGMVPVGEAHVRFPVKFYLVAMLFILFDIEVVFLFPWAVVFKPLLKDPQTGATIFTAMLTFLGILFIGYIYVWKKGALDWTQRPEREQAGS